MALWIFIKENMTLKNITLLLFYAFNAFAVSSDIFIALAWFGVTTKIAFLLSSLVILGWFFLYLSSHNEKHHESLDENKIELEAIKDFITSRLDVDYLHVSDPSQQCSNMGVVHFEFLFSLTVFHYFKKSFADSIYRAILNKEKFKDLESVLKTKFDTIKKQLLEIILEINASNLIEQKHFNYRNFQGSEKDIHKEEVEKDIKEFIRRLRFNLEYEKDKKKKRKNKKNNINSYLDLIDKLDAFSIEKRNKITAAIDSDTEAEKFFEYRELELKELLPQDKKTTLKLLLKIEHTYTLKNQREWLRFIRQFSALNALFNGFIMLTSGFAKVGLNFIHLPLFFISGIFCSYILTSPKIYNTVKDNIGYFENYCRSDNNAAKAQNPSSIFLLSLVMSFITALASGFFAFYVLHNYLITLHSHALITAGLFLSCFMSSITFCGAFSLYYDSIFAILSNNKKDIFSPQDSLESLKPSISKQDISMFAMFTISFALIYIVAINSSYLCLGLLITLLACLTTLSPITNRQITGFVATLIALSITATAIHQICIIFAPINMVAIVIISLISLVQGTTLACTFYKGLDKLIRLTNRTWEKIQRTQDAEGELHTRGDMAPSDTLVSYDGKGPVFITPERSKKQSTSKKERGGIPIILPQW